jgi:hypothetical protein
MLTRMLLRRHRDRIERVATALLAEKDLGAEQVNELTGRSVYDVPDRLPPLLRGWSGLECHAKVHASPFANGRGA